MQLFHTAKQKLKLKRKHNNPVGLSKIKICASHNLDNF